MPCERHGLSKKKNSDGLNINILRRAFRLAKLSFGFRRAPKQKRASFRSNVAHASHARLHAKALSREGFPCGPSFLFSRSSASFVVCLAGPLVGAWPGRLMRLRPFPSLAIARAAPLISLAPGRHHGAVRRPAAPCGPRRVVEALWSASSPLTRPREGGNVSPCRRARARREGEGRAARSPHLENRILRTENRIEIEFRRFRWIG